MARRTQTNTRRRETNDRRRKNDARTDRTADRSGGVRTDQGTRGSNGCYYYPLVMPGLGEAPDNSTLAQCTGTARSTVHYQDTKDNPPNPQHQEDDDAKRGTTNTRKTRGKKRAGGTVGGYKRPVVGRYHKEGTDPHRQKPNNGNLTGDKESNAKDSGGGNETSTEGLNRDDRDHEGRDNGTKTGAAKRKKKPRIGTGSSTKDLNGTPDSANNKLHSTSFQRAGTEMRRAQKNGETHIGEPKTLKDGNAKNPTGASNNSETPT